jgi:hypothetical protein
MCRRCIAVMLPKSQLHQTRLPWPRRAALRCREQFLGAAWGRLSFGSIYVIQLQSDSCPWNNKYRELQVKKCIVMKKWNNNNPPFFGGRNSVQYSIYHGVYGSHAVQTRGAHAVRDCQPKASRGYHKNPFKPCENTECSKNIMDSAFRVAYGWRGER